MLLKDEQYIIKWLSQYGPLPKAQVIRLLRDKTPETAEKIIRILKRQMRITDVGGYYLALDEMCKPDQRLCCLPRKTQKVGNHGISRNKAG